jgi:hypothetical protein
MNGTIASVPGSDVRGALLAEHDSVKENWKAMNATLS